MGVTVTSSCASSSSSLTSRIIMLSKDFLFLILVTFTLLHCPNQVTGISLRLNTVFESKIRQECYKLDMRAQPFPLGQINPAGPVGNSMENFISIIEKLEEALGRNQHRPDVIARMLLSRFRIDELIYNPLGYMFHQDPQAKGLNTVTEAMLEAAETSIPDFPEDALTGDEKCSLYYMLSHTINQTALPSDRRVYMAAPKPPINYPQSNEQSRRQNLNSRFPTQQPQQITGQVRLTEDAREQGVVGFRNHPYHAIAPGRLLLGIIAANGRSQEISTQELARLVRAQDPQQPNDREPPVREGLINIPLMVTLGELWAYGVTPSFYKDSNRIGAKGTWNTTLCQVSYQLDINYTRASLAELRGAIDGFLLGKRSVEVLKEGSNFRLSSLLRQYYSPSGLFDEFTSVCYRERIQSETSGLKEQVKSYLRVWYPVLQLGMDENRRNQLVEESSRAFEEALRMAQDQYPEERDWCRPQKFDTGINSALCETQSDAVIIVDLEGETTEQMEIVRRVSNELDMRKYGSSITLLANTKGGGHDTYSSDGLSRICWNSTNRACPSCRFAFMDKQNYGYGFRNTPDILFRAANNSLRDLKEGTKDQIAVNGRPLVIFNYGSIRKPSGDKRAFESAQWDMKYSHRDVPLLMVGPRSEEENLKVFAYDDTNDIFGLDPDVSGVTQKLSKRICETPAVIQHPRCRQETSNGVSFTGFVSRGKKQYWAMYPEFFLKSYNIAFEVKAVNGPIKVCYRRGYPKPEEDERNCKKLDPAGDNSYIMRSANPCYKFDLYNCPPFYFTIIGLNEGQTAATKCKKEKCMNMDQIEWTFTHTGVACSSAGKVLSSLFVIFAAFFIPRMREGVLF